MAKIRPFDTHFWDDQYVSELDPIEKLMYGYFFTSPLSGLSGVYEITKKRIGLDTGIESTMVGKLIQRFIDDHKIAYAKGWVILYNHLRHQPLNPNVCKAISRELKDAPSEVIDELTPDFLAICSKNDIALPKPMDSLSIETRLPKPKPKPKPNGIPSPTESWTKSILRRYEDYRGTKLVTVAPQCQALGKLKAAGLSPDDIWEKLLELEGSSDFWKDNPPDFANLAKNFHKMSNKKKLTYRINK